VRVVEVATRRVVDAAPLNEAFCGVAFSRDGATLACSGASDGVLHRFSVDAGHLKALRDVRVADPGDLSVVAGFALSRDSRSAIVALAYDSRVVRVDLETGSRTWSSVLGAEEHGALIGTADASMPNAVTGSKRIVTQSDPLNIIWDERRGRAYASLWGESAVAVLDAADGRVLARWPTGLHPNEMALSRDGRLFVSNGGLNTVTVLSSGDGAVTEVLSSAAAPGDLPGSTPDSLALSPDQRTLFVANAYTNTVAVFDVSKRGRGRPLGFIPTGWFPTSVRVTPNGRSLLVLSARGLTPKSNVAADGSWTPIGGLYRGSLGILGLPRGDAFAGALAGWTKVAQGCRPAPEAGPAVAGPIPSRVGDPSPIRYVVYIIKENRTYDQVFGDLAQGNGDPALCLFPERVTPNLHAIARQFVLLDNFYANAEVSAGGHEWSTAGYASEFVEKSWPVSYGHHASHVPYPAGARYAAALPEPGYLWDRAAAAGVSYRSYGEFTENSEISGGAGWTNLAALEGHLDPAYRSWDIEYPDRLRADEFISELHRFDAAGEMPRLQILWLPQDHTSGKKALAWTPEAMVADNDLALGRIVEALGRSRFWGRTAVFVVEDDAQNGPDHVDAHRTEALVAGPFVRRGAVDSTPYTTCSMLRTIELILGLAPMSQFDEAAEPMRASFLDTPDLAPYRALPANVDTEGRNPADGKLAEVSAGLDFSREDVADEQTLNRVIWESVRGEGSRMPAPVHAAFVRQLPEADDD
jgi:sugar lactone lactonase YvrE